MPIHAHNPRVTVGVVMRTSFFWSSMTAILLIGACPHVASADIIEISGVVTQSTPDGTGPAVNNPTLNAVIDGQTYTLTLDLTGSAFNSITSPGIYDLTGASLVFSVPSAPAAEMSFDQISLAITQSGTIDTFSLLACLTTGGGCAVGNQLTANSQIPASALNGHAAATGLDEPHPLDLIEDDGATDIHGAITTYVYTPEPSTFVFLGSCVAIVGAGLRRKPKQRG